MSTMTDTEKITKLRKTLSKILDWYRESLAERGEDYVYDMAYDEFNQLSRGDFLDILQVLAEPEEYKIDVTIK